MHRSSGRRRSAARIIGWGAVAIAYSIVLVWASGLTAGPAAAEATSAGVAGVLAAAPTSADETLALAAAPAGAAEQPAVTLALAAAMVVLAGLAYMLHALHGRLMSRAARRRESLIRVMARQITTLL